MPAQAQGGAVVNRHLVQGCSPEIVAFEEDGMRVDFCTFTDSDDRPVAVNPLQVRCIRHAPPYARTDFDKDHSVLVKASVAEVERGLTIEPD
jgi:hypothetical protein